MKKRMQAAINIGMSVVLLAASTGCSVFKSHMQTVNINCTPPDSVLMVNGEKYASPAQISVKRNKDVSIECFKDGYAPYRSKIFHHLNETGNLDIIGGCLFLVPLVGVFSPGAWSLDQTDVEISLFQK
jgi:hypothetical protein